MGGFWLLGQLVAASQVQGTVRLVRCTVCLVSDVENVKSSFDQLLLLYLKTDKKVNSQGHLLCRLSSFELWQESKNTV